MHCPSSQEGRGAGGEASTSGWISTLLRHTKGVCTGKFLARRQRVISGQGEGGEGVKLAAGRMACGAAVQVQEGQQQKLLPHPIAPPTPESPTWENQICIGNFAGADLSRFIGATGALNRVRGLNFPYSEETSGCFF